MFLLRIADFIPVTLVVHMQSLVCVPFLLYNHEQSWFVREINRIYDGVEAETRKSQASFQII